MYAFELVVRTKNGRYEAGATSEMPLREGWKQVISFGKWYGIQTKYIPYNDTLMRAYEYARRHNEEEELAEEQLAEKKYNESVE